jgi:hypothetical protein
MRSSPEATAPAVLVGGGPAAAAQRCREATAARLGEHSHAPHLAGPAAKRRASEVQGEATIQR